MSNRAFLKKSTRLFLVGIGFLILTFIFSQGAYSGNVRGVTDDTIKLGVIVDLTGPIAVNTIPYLEAARNYFRYINEQGGINGRKGTI